MFWAIGNDCYIVARLKDHLPKGDPNRYKEYIVDMKKGGMCDCIGFQRYKVKCWHIKEIINQLKSGGGAIHFQREGDLDKLFAFAERRKLLEDKK